ncbi:MAG: glutamate 5-kinase [Epsilonproteobacteria bacterium]|nr:glutamate 5-kinase [Campylobacterota bacterium]
MSKSSRKRIVVKVGSHVLTEQTRLARDRMSNLVEFLADLMKRYEVILVSSGAVAAGYSKLKLDKKILNNRQAIASVGQPYLMSAYAKKLARFDILSAQILLSASDFDSRKRTLHSKCTVDTLIDKGVLPIVNENDATDISELVFGDNDQMSAHVAYYFDADMLVILSDIDGYYTKDPREHDDAMMRKEVAQIEAHDLEVPHTPNHSFATGGIVTKLKAAKFLLDRDKEMFMASGFDLTDVRSFLLDGVHLKGTYFKGAS